jgi:SAM-dependent methyltransferase
MNTLADIQNTTLTAAAIFLILVAALWFIVPLTSGLAWVPARAKRIRRALQMAELRPGETLYDLGAGDGRVLVAAAREFGARAVGIEISPIHCLTAILRARLAGVSRQVAVRPGSFFHADLSGADVIYAYLTSRQAERLRPCLESQLKPGARVVTISAEIDGWQPEQIDRQELIFLYHMPPTSGSLASYLARDILDVGKP